MKFVIDGFPRQGNTTLIRVIKNVFENQAVNEYPSHDLSLIDQKIKDNNVILFPIRDPLDTLGSFLGMQVIRFPEKKDQPIRDRAIARALSNLKMFQEYVIEDVSKVKIIKFEDIVNMSEDYKNQNIINNRLINKLSKEYILTPVQVNNQLFNSFSEFSSTKNPEFEQELLAEKFKKILDLIVNNYNFLVDKSY